MAKITLSKLRFLPIITQIRKEYNLTYQQAAVYGYLFNHCMNINDEGYCGYSDQRIADELDLGIRALQRELEVLKKVNENTKKSLIIVKNQGKRTKKQGESRMIYINTEVYMDELQMDLNDIEIENLRKENKKLRESLDEYRKYPSIRKNIYTETIIKSGVIPADQHDYMCQMLAIAYEGMAVDIGHTKTINHVNYVIMHAKATKPSNPVAYFIESFKSYSRKMNHIDFPEKTKDDEDDNFGY